MLRKIMVLNPINTQTDEAGFYQNYSSEEVIFNEETNPFVENDFDIIPNPNNGSFLVQFGSHRESTCLITVYDVTGKLVFTEIITQSKNYNLTFLQAGVYLIHLDDSEKNLVKKMIVQ